MRAVLIGLIASVTLAGAADAQSVSAGSYLCSVEQYARIGSAHYEGAGPPDTLASTEVYRFRIVVTVETEGRLRIEEAPYDGPDRSQWDWGDDNSTLHSAYIGDGRAFVANDGPGFLNFGGNRWGEGLQFYHSGFQFAAGEDESVAVRWGRCSRQP